MRKGSQKQIYSKRPFSNGVENKDFKLLRVEGENLEPFEFQDNGCLECFVVVSCIADFTLDAKVNKIIYKDDSTNKLYFENVDFTLKFDSSYNKFVPKSPIIDYTFADSYYGSIRQDHMIVRLSNDIFGTSKNNSISIKSVESRYDGVSLKFVGYDKISEDKKMLHILSILLLMSI